jgi:hypothetical protein
VTTTTHDFVPGQPIGGAPETELCQVCGLVQDVPDHSNRSEGSGNPSAPGSEDRAGPAS